MQLIKYSFYLAEFSLIFLLTSVNSVEAKAIDNQSNLVSVRKNRPHQPVSSSVKDLLAQQNPVTRITGVEINQTDQGLKVILKTAAGGEKLVPLILPEENNLVVDILDATLASSIRNGVTKSNPAPGINQ
ncbi:MAG: AMIN domain-containing protein, partial [Waterburya sp.]